jgi:sRNA-binding carbon storage regulator CsrA
VRKSKKDKPPTAGNLVLTRRKGEIIHLHTTDGLVSIAVKRITQNFVALTFNAPDAVNIVRSEIDGIEDQADQ